MDRGWADGGVSELWLCGLSRGWAEVEPGYKFLSQGAKITNLIRWLGTVISRVRIPTGLCALCCTAKLRKRIPGESQYHAKEALDRIYTDYWGPFKTENLTDSWYFILTMDENTRYCWIEITNTRTAKALVDLMKSLIDRIQRQYNKKIKFWRTNNTREFINGPFQNLLKRNYNVTYPVFGHPPFLDS
jgi:hypothetical protein